MIVCRRCGKRKKVQNLGKRPHWTCSTCANSTRPKIRVTCAGCGVEREVYGRTAAEAEPNFTYYLCSPCTRERKYQHPAIPEGMIRSLEFNVFGYFTRYQLRPMTLEDRESIERARRIRDAGLELLFETDSPWVN